MPEVWERKTGSIDKCSTQGRSIAHSNDNERKKGGSGRVEVARVQLVSKSKSHYNISRKAKSGDSLTGPETRACLGITL